MTLSRARIGPLQLAADTVELTDRYPRQTALQTYLLVHNRGKKAIRVQIKPLSEFIGKRRLLVVGPRCGYAQRRPGAPVKPGPCLTVLVVPAPVAPGASTKLSVTALVGLSGMSPLAAGSYSVRVPLTIGEETTAVTLTYDVRRLMITSHGRHGAAFSRTSPQAHKPAARDVLYGNGIGTAGFGEKAGAAIHRLDVLLGRTPSKAYHPNHACDVDHESDWRGLNAFFADGRFVGYAYWPARDRGTVFLATAKGLRVGDRLSNGRRLYGREFRVSPAQGGSWSATTRQGPMFGYTSGDPNGPQSTVASIDAGHVGCPAMTP